MAVCDEAAVLMVSMANVGSSSDLEKYVELSKLLAIFFFNYSNSEVSAHLFKPVGADNLNRV
jgi:hypothetical protein